MHRIIVQHTTDTSDKPEDASLQRWINKALINITKPVEVTIRIVDLQEITELNQFYRQKAGPTNVLSFPFDMPDGVELDAAILGDIVICAEVVNNEAKEQNKAPEAHWAHMVIHGALHLIGYDHVTDDQANVMEALEVKLMRNLGYPNPYELGVNIKHYD